MKRALKNGVLVFSYKAEYKRFTNEYMK